jgi:hypothetical protein
MTYPTSAPRAHGDGAHWWGMFVHLRLPLVGYVCQLKAGVLISRWWDMFLVQEVVALLMVQQVTLVEALLGMERSSERSSRRTED